MQPVSLWFLHLCNIHDMQQASCKAEPGDYKHAVNDTYVGMKLSNINEVANVGVTVCYSVSRGVAMKLLPN